MSSAQFGFLPTKSSCSQLLDCFYNWSLSFFNNISTSVVYTDIRKAFDSVSHRKLIEVLESYSLHPTIVTWISNYLSHRFQQVILKDKLSPMLEVQSGVPQGSVLGPLLFLIFINDLCLIADNLNFTGGIRLYADDAKLFSTNPCLLQESLNSSVSVLHSRQLKVAPEKCFVLNIQKRNLPPQSHSFIINNHTLSNQQHIKDLGVYFSHDLSFSFHVNYVYKQASLRSYQVLKSCKTRNVWTLVKLYKTYVRPKTEYNTCVWSPYLVKDINKIESIQSHFTRTTCLRCKIPFKSYQDRLFKLGLLSLRHRRVYFDLIFLFKIINNLSDLKFEQYFEFKTTKYNLRDNKLQPLHHFKNTQWMNSFVVRSCRWWNRLPSHIKAISSLDSFKQHIKKIDFDKLDL